MNALKFGIKNWQGVTTMGGGLASTTISGLPTIPIGGTLTGVLRMEGTRIFISRRP
jgi:hypothetical protein